MKLVYFAWVREHIGVSGEAVALHHIVGSGGVVTVADLVAHLRGRGSGYSRALANMQVVRVAVNREFASLDTVIGGDDEIAFFPPITGG